MTTFHMTVTDGKVLVKEMVAPNLVGPTFLFDPTPAGAVECAALFTRNENWGENTITFDEKVEYPEVADISPIRMASFLKVVSNIMMEAI